MQRSLSILRVIVLISNLLILNVAQAHYVWIEQDAQGAKLYFGEFEANLREASPGVLDRFVKPTAQKLTAKGSEPLQLNKTANGFALSARAAMGESLVAEELSYPITNLSDGEKPVRSLYIPGARLVTHYGKQAPVLTLDLVPTGQSSADTVQLQAFYKGKPLPKAKVNLFIAAGWEQEHETDEQGLLTVKLPWKGTYVLELMHSDGAGERGTEKYERTSYATALTLMQAKGLPAPAAVPAAPPNKMR